MDWHKDENNNAQNFYPSRGRKGKKFTGVSSKTVLFRQKQNKLVMPWIEKELKMTDGHIPLREDALRRLDERRMGQDLGLGFPTLVIAREIIQPRRPDGTLVVDSLERQRRLRESPVPEEILKRVADGLAQVEMLASAFGMKQKDAAQLVEDFKKENKG